MSNHFIFPKINRIHWYWNFLSKEDFNIITRRIVIRKHFFVDYCSKWHMMNSAVVCARSASTIKVTDLNCAVFYDLINNRWSFGGTLIWSERRKWARLNQMFFATTWTQPFEFKVPLESHPFFEIKLHASNVEPFINWFAILTIARNHFCAVFSVVADTLDEVFYCTADSYFNFAVINLFFALLHLNILVLNRLQNLSFSFDRLAILVLLELFKQSPLTCKLNWINIQLFWTHSS